MRTWLVRILTRCLLVLRQLLSWLHRHARRRGSHTPAQTSPSRRVFAQPKPMGTKRHHPAESPAAAGEVPDDCASLQSPVAISETHDGE
mgnify:CR=1 FL=1